MRWLALAVLTLITACAPRPEPKMDWKALTDYLAEQERQK